MKALTALFALVCFGAAAQVTSTGTITDDDSSGGLQVDCSLIDVENAASATTAAINTALTNVMAGGCVMVPAGTFSGSITLPAKDVQVFGVTVVTCTGTAGQAGYVCSNTGGSNTQMTGGFIFNLGFTQRVSGFVLIQAGGDDEQPFTCTGTPNATDWFRVDRNVLSAGGGAGNWEPMRFGRCVSGSVHASGIFDHNRVEGGLSLHVNGTLNQLDDSAPGNQTQGNLWAEDIALGGTDERVFLEANYMVSPGGDYVNFSDGNYGARSAHRRNNLVGAGARAGFEFHSPQGYNRGYHRWEVIQNYFEDLGGGVCFQGMVFIRGGTGVMFGNQMVGDTEDCNNKILLDNVRSQTDTYEVFDNCNGSAPAGVDQNTTGQQGWHCRDQIGVSHDLSVWDFVAPFGAYNQAFQPAYFWLNKVDGAYYGVDIDPTDRNDIHIVENRDLYVETSGAFNGTVGVGSGTLASRPATCTVGVAYWVTDQGEWDDTNGATADGRLDVCESTNTWTAEWYKPAPYPDPRTVAE